jgi:ferredoxin-NADP reductase
MTTNIKLLKKEIIANDTMAFTWEKPDGFEYVAGQNGDFTLINPTETDTEGNTRTFSFVSTPDEKTLMTATRLRDTAYKRALKNLPIDSSVQFKGPYGDFKLHKNPDKPAIFIIGGIGITPVISIISDATKRKLPHKITLLYSNRTPEDTPFISDINNLVRLNSNLNFISVYTKLAKNEWGGEVGHINGDMLKKHLPNIVGPTYYLAGPSEMVATMRQLLIDIGADEDDIKIEEFIGY